MTTEDVPILSETGKTEPPDPDPQGQLQWPYYMPIEEYFGVNKAPEAHDGTGSDAEKTHVGAIQDRLKTLNFLKDDAEAYHHGTFEESTEAAVTAWQHENMTQTEFYGRVYFEDWNVLFTY